MVETCRNRIKSYEKARQSFVGYFVHFIFIKLQKSITIAARNLDFERISMSAQQPKAKKALVKLPFPMPSAADESEEDAVHNHVRPKPEQYADRTFMPPRGTRRSMGKR